MVTSIGSNGPKNLPGYPESNEAADGTWTVTEQYWVASGWVSASLPDRYDTTNQFGDTVTSPDGDTLKCMQRTIRQGPSPDTRIVELTYSQTSDQIIIQPPSENPRQVRLSYLETSIDDSRLLTTNGGPFTQAEIDDFAASGVEQLPLPVAEYTYTEVDDSFVWSESNITANLFANNSPTGVSGTTLSKWRLTGREIDETDNEVIIRTTWEFCNSGWDIP